MTSWTTRRVRGAGWRRLRSLQALAGLSICLLLTSPPAAGQDREEVETGSGSPAAAAGKAGGTAVVRVVTEPEYLAGGTFVFTGTPAGELTLMGGGQAGLTAAGLAAGSHVSKLSEIDPAMAAAGYTLRDIRCDDQDSADPSIGKLENRAAILRIEESETVTCTFVLSMVEVGSIGSASDCICPKEGRWNVQNLEGAMDCRGAFVLNRKLKPVRDKGVILVMEDDCSRLFGDSTTKKEEDVLMTRVDGCGYAGTIDGEEEGIDMVIDVIWTIENQQLIKGEMSSTTSQMGITCDLYRPFELTFDEALSENEYQKWEKRIIKKMEKK